MSASIPDADMRTLEQRLIDYLFPKPGPQDKALKVHGATEGDRLALKQIPEHLQRQLVRLCDVNPVVAHDLIRLALDFYDTGFDEGREDGFGAGIREEREAVSERLQDLAKEWSKR